MKIEKKFVFAALVFIFTLLWIFTLNASGFSLKTSLLLANYATTIITILSPSFILSVIFFTLPIVIAGIATKKMDSRKEAKQYCTGGAILAVMLGIPLFPTIIEHWLVFAFYLGSFPIAMDSAYFGFLELKRFITPRAVASAVKKTNLLVAAGLFLASALIIMPNPEYVKSFETSLLSSMSNGDVSRFDLSEPLTNQIIQTQKQTIQAITQLPAFEKLRAKQDTDVNLFVVSVDMLSTTISSDSYRQQIKEQVKNSQQQLLGNQGGMTNAIEIAKQQIPELQQFETYLWLFEAILAVSIFLPLANLFTPLLAMLFAIIADKLIKDPQKAS